MVYSSLLKKLSVYMSFSSKDPNVNAVTKIQIYGLLRQFTDHPSQSLMLAMVYFEQ